MTTKLPSERLDQTRQEEFMSDSELDPTVAPEGLSAADDQRLGVGGAAQAANLALLALSRAARSFLVYDARNDAIRGFLQDWKESWKQVPAEVFRTRQVLSLPRTSGPQVPS